MSSPVSVNELRTVIGASDLPEEHLQWIIDRSELHEYNDGDMVVKTGGSADYMFFLLEGKIDYYADVNGTLVYYFTFENDRFSGGITGVIPHSRMKTYAGCTFSVGSVRILALHRKYFPELEQLNPDFIQKLIGYMTERARAFATIQLQREKVSALGKLSAGIAHELNNPAAAINRISAELTTRLHRNYELTSKLLSEQVSADQIQMIEAKAKEKQLQAHQSLSALDKMNAEDEINDWFATNNIPENPEAAETFSEFGFTTDDLSAMSSHTSAAAFAVILRWLENLLISERLLNDLEEASSRISHLVGAIKSHVHMDRTNDAQKTSIHTDIDNTLALMGYKLRDKNINLTKIFAADMPMIDAYVGELNQVWTNLIDNAIDAMEKNGSLEIETTFDQKNVTVCVTDDGSGIPKDIISRIFDPFFTTKKVGQGTGIGLDTVKRVIDRHHGEIKVESEPGRTHFTVCIPRTQPTNKA